jgi:WD40 repeat protein
MIESTIHSARRRTLEGWLRFIRAESHILQEYPDLLFQLATNQPDSTEPARLARQRWLSGRQHRSWLRWINKPRALSPCVMTLVGHAAGVIEAVAVSSDGKRIVAGGDDGIVRVWDARSGQEVFQLAGHRSTVRALAVDARSRSIASGSDDGTIKVWDSESGTARFTLAAHEDLIEAFAISPSDSTLISADNKTVRLWDLRTGRAIDSFEGRGPVAVSPDGRRFAHAAGYEFSVRDLPSGRHLYNVGGTTAIVFSPRGGRLVSSHDELVLVYDAETGGELTRFTAYTHSTPALLITPDERYLITGHKHGEIKIWDLKMFEELHLADRSGGAVRTLVPLGGRRFVSLGRDDRSVSVWDTESGSVLQTLTGHADGVTALAPVPGTSHLVTASRDGALKVWDTECGSEPEQLGARGCVGPIITPDRKRVVCGSHPGFSLWDAVDGRLLWWEKGHLIAVSPDRKRAFVTGGSGESRWIKVWELESRRELLTIEHPHAWHTIVTKDGCRIVSASNRDVPQDLRIWDASTGRELHHLSAHSPLRFSVDERAVIARRSWFVLKAWDQQTGETHRRVRVPGWYKRIWLTSDGSRILGQIERGRFEVFDSQTGEALFTLDARWPPEQLFWREDDFYVNGNASRLVVCRETSIDILDSRTGQLRQRASIAEGSRPFLTSDAQYVALRIDYGKGCCILEYDNGHTVLALRGFHPAIVALSSDGAHFAAGADGSLRLWDVRSGALVAHRAGAYDAHADGSFLFVLTALTVTPGGRFVAATLEEGTLAIWDTATNRVERVPGTGPVVASADGTWLAFRRTENKTSSIEVWDLKAGHSTRSLECSSEMASLAFSSDSRELMVLDAKVHDVWFELESGEEMSLPLDEPSGRAEMHSTVSDREEGEFQIVAIGEQTVGVRDRLSGELLARFLCPEKIASWTYGERGEQREMFLPHAVAGNLLVVGGQEIGGVYILCLERSASAAV